MLAGAFFYELSLEADRDLDEIFDYTNQEFGVDQAIKYLIDFEIVFESLCSNPRLGRPRDEVRKGLRSVSKERHTVFYKIMKDRVWIVRVLHGSRDIHKFFPPQ